jgi:tetratricopeptide (TPR) repeat protein
MSSPSESQLDESEQVESYKERINLLFEELSFAIQWQRPSILLAFHDSEYLRQTVEFVLESRLAEIGQQVVRFKVNERRFDIPLLLSKRPDRDRSVYFVTGLFQGGGKEDANAYRALNMRREYFVDYAIRVIIWLSKGEAVKLSHHAPDFWAFRHRVVEFYDTVGPEFFVISANELSWRNREPSVQPKDLDEQITLREALLGELPGQAGSLLRRMDLLSTLANLYLENKAWELSIQRSKQGIIIAKQLNDAGFLAKFWGNLGRTYLELGQPARAIRSCWKAIRFNPRDADLWTGLEQAYLVQGRVETARSVFRKAAIIKPLDKNT